LKRNRVILKSHLEERRILLQILHGDGTGRYPDGRLQHLRDLLKDYDIGLDLLAPQQQGRPLGAGMLHEQLQQHVHDIKSPYNVAASYNILAIKKL
jgi:hypothetical protein